MGKTSIGLQENVASMLCYLLTWVSGLVFFLIEKENKTVRFHAIQSMVVFGALFVIGLIPFVGVFLLPLTAIASLVLWIVLMVTAFQGKTIKIPLASSIAEKHA